MSQSVVCLVPDEESANKIYINLQNSGFSINDIWVLMPDKGNKCELGYERYSRRPEGIAIGASSGTIARRNLGKFTGAETSIKSEPGAFIAVGPIMGAVGSKSIVGSLGGSANGLLGLELPEYEAKHYEGKLQEGNILLSVHTPTSAQAYRAENLLKALGAQYVKYANRAKVERH